MKGVEIQPWGVNVVFGDANLIFAVYFLGYIFAAFTILARKSLRAPGALKTQILYILLGLSLTTVLATITNLIIPFAFNYFYLSKYGHYFTVFFIIFTAYASTKHHLMDISVIISRAVAEVLTVLFLGSIYLSLAWLYLNYLSTKIDPLFILWTVAYGIMVGQVHQKIRLFIQTTSDKVFLRGKYDYYRELAEISSQISRSLSLENILETLKRTFYEVIEVSNPRIYLFSDFEKPEVKELLSIKEPTFKEENLILPCVIENRTAALIVLGLKLSKDPYTDEDLRLLKALASQTAVALDRHRLYEETLKAQKQLLLAEKLTSIGNVAADLAREVRNPLQVLERITQEADWEKGDHDSIKNFKETAIKEIDHLNGLVDNPLKMARTPRVCL